MIEYHEVNLDGVDPDDELVGEGVLQQMLLCLCLCLCRSRPSAWTSVQLAES